MNYQNLSDLAMRIIRTSHCSTIYEFRMSNFVYVNAFQSARFVTRAIKDIDFVSIKRPFDSLAIPVCANGHRVFSIDSVSEILRDVQLLFPFSDQL